MHHTLLFVLFACLYSSIVGAVQDRQPSKISTAQQCPDGRPGLVNQLQAETQSPYQPAIYVTDCSPHRNETHANRYDGRPGTAAVSQYSRRSVERRAINMCSAGCLNACSWSSSGPSSSDCSALSNYIASRGTSFTVDGWQKITATSGTCMTTFLNLNILSVTWCDSTWASQSSGLASSCSTGGTCFGTLFDLTTESNPDYTPPVNTPTSPSPPSSPSNTPTTPNSPASSTNPGNANNNGNGNNGNAATSSAIHSASGSNNGASSENAVSSSSGTNAETGTGVEGVRFYTSSLPITTLSNGSVVGLSGTVTFGVNPSATCSDASSCSDINPTSIITNAHKPATLSDNPGAIAGIIIGIVLLMGIFVFFMCWRRRRNRVGQTIIVGPLDEEKERPEVEVISEPRSPSDRAYTIMSGNSAGFGRVLEHSSGQSPQTPLSPASRNSVMSTGMGESRISYVPFWDMIRGEQKGTVSDLGLDDGERSSESSCYSNEQRKLQRHLSEHRDARLSSHVPEGQDRQLVMNPEPVQSVRASSDEFHADRSKSDPEEAYATPLSYPSINGSPTVAPLVEQGNSRTEGTS